MSFPAHQKEAPHDHNDAQGSSQACVSEHVEVLRVYALRVLVQGEVLSDAELSDKENCIVEFL